MSSVHLVDFLKARLDEDEAVAREATPGPWSVRPETRSAHSMLYGEADVSGPGGRAVAQDRDGGCTSTEDAAHIARHDPARVLADIAAKRQLVEGYAEAAARCPDDDWPEDGDMSEAPVADHARWALRCLGLPYADHPDYIQEWKP